MEGPTPDPDHGGELDHSRARASPGATQRDTRRG